jgi:hypothetical protein
MRRPSVSSLVPAADPSPRPAPGLWSDPGPWSDAGPGPWSDPDLGSDPSSRLAPNRCLSSRPACLVADPQAGHAGHWSSVPPLHCRGLLTMDVGGARIDYFMISRGQVDQTGPVPRMRVPPDRRTSPSCGGTRVGCKPGVPGVPQVYINSRLPTAPPYIYDLSGGRGAVGRRGPAGGAVRRAVPWGGAVRRAGCRWRHRHRGRASGPDTGRILG